MKGMFGCEKKPGKTDKTKTILLDVSYILFAHICNTYIILYDLENEDAKII